jgi:hypothetical protein
MTHLGVLAIGALAPFLLLITLLDQFDDFKTIGIDGSSPFSILVELWLF